MKAESLAAAKYTAERAHIIHSEAKGVAPPKQQLKQEAAKCVPVGNNTAAYANEPHLSTALKQRAWHSTAQFE